MSRLQATSWKSKCTSELDRNTDLNPLEIHFQLANDEFDYSTPVHIYDEILLSHSFPTWKEYMQEKEGGKNLGWGFHGEPVLASVIAAEKHFKLPFDYVWVGEEDLAWTGSRIADLFEDHLHNDVDLLSGPIAFPGGRSRPAFVRKSGLTLKETLMGFGCFLEQLIMPTQALRYLSTEDYDQLYHTQEHFLRFSRRYLANLEVWLLLQKKSFFSEYLWGTLAWRRNLSVGSMDAKYIGDVFCSPDYAKDDSVVKSPEEWERYKRENQDCVRLYHPLKLTETRHGQ